MRRLILTIAMLAAACSPEPPAAPREPARDADFTVSTMASTADRRFLVQFQSLTNRELCISANEWPTAEGYLGENRPADAGDEVIRVGSRDALVAFVRFDQVPAASRSGDAVHQVDFVPQVFFCGIPAAQ
jgi:hypothetical protein